MWRPSFDGGIQCGADPLAEIPAIGGKPSRRFGRMAAKLGRLRGCPRVRRTSVPAASGRQVETMRHMVFGTGTSGFAALNGIDQAFTRSAWRLSCTRPGRAGHEIVGGGQPASTGVEARRAGSRVERWMWPVRPMSLSAPAPVPAGRGWRRTQGASSVLELRCQWYDAEWAPTASA